MVVFQTEHGPDSSALIRFGTSRQTGVYIKAALRTPEIPCALESGMARLFHPITDGGMHSRVRDSFGSGQPGAPRGSHLHKGIDVVTRPMQRILSPIDGDVIREAFPYPDDPAMRGILIRGVGDHAGFEVKLFYVLGLFSGRTKAGGLIGHAQDLTTKYPGITNHVHLEVFRNRLQIDPREPFAMSF